MRLFTRLLLAQLATALAVAVLLFGLFYVDRSITVSRLLAQRWAPAIQAALGQLPDAPPPLPEMQRRGELPEGAIPMAGIAPRYAALRSTLAAHGLQVQRVAVSAQDGVPTVWMQFERTAGQPPLWLGVADPLVESRLPGRFLFALAVCAALMGGLSWALARHLTRPLDTLRQRMQGLQPGNLPLPESAPASAGSASTPVPGASPEVAAINDAWRELQQRLVQHEQERALMLAGISHDLRSPLARIRMAAELLPDDPALQPRRESLQRNVQVADRLIQSFLDHARALQAPLDQAVDLGALAAEVLATRAAAGEHIEAALPPPGAPPLRLPAAHPLLLERVLHNLLDNAFQHGRAPVQLRLRAEAAHAVLEVQDAGEGIHPALQASALQAFSRGDASRSRPGTGLGLAIVQQTVQRLGGRIEFDGAPGAHIVRLVLPLRTAAAPPTPAAAARGSTAN